MGAQRVSAASGTQKGVAAPRTGVTDGHELPWGCWELDFCCVSMDKARKLILEPKVLCLNINADGWTRLKLFTCAT